MTAEERALLEIIPKPAATTVNVGLRPAGAADLRALLGEPRADYTGSCQPVTNTALRQHLVTRDVGPFRATGHRAALESLKGVLAPVRTEVPALFGLLGTEGMLCARRIKRPDGQLGRNPSNHSWGLAIDIKLAGKVDRHGDDLTQRGLLILARYFNAAGWYWGVSFPNEDSMHYEPSMGLLRAWRRDGTI